MAAALCGHVRCYGLTACQVGKVPPMECMPPGVERVNVREAYRSMMLEVMASDREWTLALARLTALDATR